MRASSALFVLCLSKASWAFVPSGRTRSQLRIRYSVVLESFANRPDIQRAKAFLLKDQTARYEKLGAGLSIEAKEEILGTPGGDIKTWPEAYDHSDGAAADAVPKAVGDAASQATVDSTNAGRTKGLSAEPAASEVLVAAAAAEGPDDWPEDPLLGQLVADTGEKRVYLASVPQLIRLPVWEKQRVYRQERSKAIALDKLRRRENSGAPMSFPGVITVYEKAWEPVEPLSESASEEALNAARSRFGIVDGQHRVGALRVLFGRGEFDQRVLMEVIPLPTDAAVSDLFTDINKAEPVKDVDLPGVASEFERDALASAASALQTNYPEMFKSSTKCKKPHLHVDNLRDALFASGVLARHGFTDDEELLSWLLVENDKLAARPDKEWLAAAGAVRKGGVAGPAFEKALAKARAFKFFLGMDEAWLEN